MQHWQLSITFKTGITLACINLIEKYGNPNLCIRSYRSYRGSGLGLKKKQNSANCGEQWFHRNHDVIYMILTYLFFTGRGCEKKTNYNLSGRKSLNEHQWVQNKLTETWSTRSVPERSEGTYELDRLKGNGVSWADDFISTSEVATTVLDDSIDREPSGWIPLLAAHGTKQFRWSGVSCSGLESAEQMEREVLELKVKRLILPRTFDMQKYRPNRYRARFFWTIFWFHPLQVAALKT